MFVSQIRTHSIKHEPKNRCKQITDGLVKAACWFDAADSGVKAGQVEKQTGWSLQWQKTRTVGVYVPPAALKNCECETD